MQQKNLSQNYRQSVTSSIQQKRSLGSVLLFMVLCLSFILLPFVSASALTDDVRHEPLEERLARRGVASEHIAKLHDTLTDQIARENNGSDTDEMRVIIRKKEYEGPYTGVFGLMAQGVDQIRESMSDSRISRTISQNGKVHRAFDDMDVATITEEGLASLIDDDAVLDIYPDRKHYPSLVESVPALNAPDWWQSGYSGTGVAIAILDSGIEDTHDAFATKTIIHKSTVPSNDTSDVSGHGTHVASTAAGNPFHFITTGGVAPNASLMNVRVIRNEGYAYTSDIIAGIYMAIDPNNDSMTDDAVDIISMSLGGAYPSISEPYRQAILDAIDAGTIVVAAAGNCGALDPSSSCGGFTGVTVPGRMKEVITVGSVDHRASDASAPSSGAEYISGVGIKPDISAPGVSITAAYPGNQVQTMSGTSMATPHVAGAIALVRERFPGITHKEVKALLELTAQDRGPEGNDIHYGFGVVDMNITSYVLSNYELVTVPLEAGKNLIGFGPDAPLSLDYLTDSNPSLLKAIGSYNASTEVWDQAVPSLHETITTLSAVDTSQGTYLLLSDNSTLTFLVRYPSSQDITLEKGWNLVIYPFSTAQPVDAYFSPVLENIDAVQGVENQTDLFWYHPRFDGLSTTLLSLEPHHAYWVRAGSAVTFTATP